MDDILSRPVTIKDQRWILDNADRADLKLWRHNTAAAALGKGQYEFYQYDGLYQVKQRDKGTLNTNRTDISGIPSQAEDWIYNLTGNWDNYQRQASGTTQIDQDRSHNEVNEITKVDGTSAPVHYDAAGNMTRIPIGEVPSEGHYEATWDAWNRLVRLKTPGAGDTPSSSSSSSSSSSPAGFQLDIKYEYDGLTRRTRKITLVGGDVANPSPVDFYYNTAWKCVEERLASQSAPRKQFFYGIRGRNDLICRDRYPYDPNLGSSSSSSSSSSHTPERLYALNDAMGSVTALALNGDTVERYSYTAFGQSQVMDGSFTVRAESFYDWQVRFHGEQKDMETGFYNYGYRYYFPELGKWLSRDPLGESGGMNLIIFIDNDSLNTQDYLGLQGRRRCIYCGGKLVWAGDREVCCGGKLISSGHRSACCKETKYDPRNFCCVKGEVKPRGPRWAVEDHDSVGECVGKYTCLGLGMTAGGIGLAELFAGDTIATLLARSAAGLLIGGLWEIILVVAVADLAGAYVKCKENICTESSGNRRRTFPKRPGRN